MNMTIRCTCCGEDKPFEAFHKQKASKRGCKCICKDCVREKNQDRYKNNKEDILAKNKKWRDKKAMKISLQE